jgi:4-hydroxy-2-oxoheptanedioate aldolase
MLYPSNRLRGKIQDGQAVFGFICRTLSAPVVELIGMSGFDFVWIDMEHTAADYSAVESLCRAADATGIEPLVRVPDKSQSSILRALEAGARIVNVPQVEHRSEAEAAVRASKYHPIGERGYCPSSRGNGYGLGGTVPEILAAANERVWTMVQIESLEGVRNAAEICATPGLDVVFVGTGDLSQSLGVPGQLNHPEVVAQTRRTLDIIRRSGKVPAMLVDSTESAKTWADSGVQMLCCGVDLVLLGKTLRRLQADFRQVAGARQSATSG